MSARLKCADVVWLLDRAERDVCVAQTDLTARLHQAGRTRPANPFPRLSGACPAGGAELDAVACDRCSAGLPA